MSEKFYITTAIDYPNGSPHMGHAYEKTVTDCYARWYRFLGKDTYFLTGTDENGQKLSESAKAEGIETQDFVDKNADIFRDLCQKMSISNDDFIRTTEERHANVASQLWKKLESSGDIYSGSYSGWYCLSCENFYTELQAPDKICPDHGKPLTLKEEEGFFFKLSNYHDWIVDHIKSNPNFVVPSASYKEILSRLNQEPLRDLAISRPNAGWGIPLPNNENFVMYTWFDALINYYSALQNDQTKQKYWPADVHVIGKDILWFHSIIWPCMLKALELPLPKQVYVHGMILAEDGRAMSKSLGNGVNPYEIMEKYPLESFRYYLLRGISSMGDGAFSTKDLVQKHNSELGNDFGNLIMRVIKLSLKILPAKMEAGETKQELNFQSTFERMSAHMEKREHNRALDVLWESINEVNQYINEKEPWKLKTDPEKFKDVIYNCLFGIQSTASLMTAFLPETAASTLDTLGVQAKGFEDLKFSGQAYDLKVPEALFPKIDLPQ